MKNKELLEQSLLNLVHSDLGLILPKQSDRVSKDNLVGLLLKVCLKQFNIAYVLVFSVI